jgi:hypothetical protein
MLRHLVVMHRSDAVADKIELESLWMGDRGEGDDGVCANEPATGSVPEFLVDDRFVGLRSS